MVATCTSITVTYCDLTNLIQDYRAAYKVRVQLAAGEDSSQWRVVRKFLPNNSKWTELWYQIWIGEYCSFLCSVWVLWIAVSTLIGRSRPFQAYSDPINSHRVSLFWPFQAYKHTPGQLIHFSVPVGELLPPSFTLWATSSTLTVKVHQRPILRKLFPFGITYTIYLEERGQEEKVGIRIGLKDINVYTWMRN